MRNCSVSITYFASLDLYLFLTELVGSSYRLLYITSISSNTANVLHVHYDWVPYTLCGPVTFCLFFLPVIPTYVHTVITFPHLFMQWSYYHTFKSELHWVSCFHIFTFWLRHAFGVFILIVYSIISLNKFLSWHSTVKAMHVKPISTLTCICFLICLFDFQSGHCTSYFLLFTNVLLLFYRFWGPGVA